MNTKVWALAAAAALTVSLAGCMPVQNSQSGSGDSVQNQTVVQNPFNKNASTQEQEPDTVELKVQGQNGVQTVEATVYTGSSYTIAIPSEGWERDKNEPQWNPTGNDDVELTIRFYTGKTADEAVKLLTADEDDYVFETPIKTTLGEGLEATQLSGTETKLKDNGETDMTQMIVYFAQTDAGCYALILECPDLETERYGGYLAAMANSFTLVQD